jgi:hypothetical protein
MCYLVALQDRVQINLADNMHTRLRGPGKPYLHKVDFVILRHIFLKDKLCNPEIWYTSIYGFSVSIDFFRFHT